MSKRFMLTAAGTASAAVAGIASAELIDFTVIQDQYIGEASYQIINSAGSTVASMYISGSSIFLPGASSAVFSAGSTSSGAVFYETTFTLDLSAGDYTVAMQDNWGDGWNWNGIQGGITVSGNLDGASSANFSFLSGASAGGSFTVVPAPGALALLGLAGVAGRRRRG